MSNQPTHSNQTEEIDLGYLFKKLGDFFKRCVKLLFLIIAFFIKFKIIVIFLILIGLAYGYYKDITSKKIYANEAIVIPNFGSVDYLYDKVKAINTKISANDTLYLQAILDTNFRKIKKIEIEPIIDIYNFAAQSRENIDIFRILFQNQELAEFVEDLTTSKYYKYHRINFTVVGNEDSELIIKQLLDYFNNNEHYNQYQEINTENTALLIKESTIMISQIDSLIQSAIRDSSKNNGSQSVNINDKSDLGTLIYRKQEILKSRLELLTKEKDQVQIIKQVSLNYNLTPEKGFSISNKIKYPILFVLLFSLVFFIRYAYNKLEAIAKSN
ncbi:MAG: hypothetical protein COZ75_05510 [Flavobacteriaceae bacterium CG_4_8_14_3_um_filter_34_10]|nr:hypothetical protein [Flavobacteriia bacterium]PIX09704.1 MAG: hypothetical protein COZ75_05510 [Flavobacteriaceae bacterium CG_4_8_14_3_um_filter_34_10]